MAYAATSRTTIVDSRGNPIRSSSDRQKLAASHARYQALRAKYDAAITNDDNRKHWGNADHLSASAAANPEVRRRLRSRARYECQESNSFAKGIILTLANDIIGRGPDLHIRHENRRAAQQLERNFRRWMKRVNLAATLRTAVGSLVVDGEVFGVTANNRNVRNDVQLDVRLMEADQCTDLRLVSTRDHEDGIDYDADGYPVRYHFLEHHPGDLFPLSQRWKTKPLVSDQVIHYFRKDRPGQRRGIPWIASALPLFALLRRYTLAVTMAAETAANFAGVMYADGNQVVPDDDVDPMDAIEFEMRSMLTLPIGWKLGQLKAEQPTTTYQMFRDAILTEIARCINMPFNKAAGDSSKYNYASGRLDHQTYFGAIDIGRSDLECQVLDRIFHWWSEEATFVPGAIPPGIGPIDQLDYAWRWPRHQHIDPLKQASADVLLWSHGLLSDEEYQIENGRDPEDHYASLERQRDRRVELNLPVPGQIQLPPDMFTRDEEPEEAEADAA